MTAQARGNVTVIGAGISGLLSAYYLDQAGYSVKVLEGQDGPGGMIGTLQTDFGKIESAANGFMASARLEALFADLGLRPVQAGKNGKKRFIFRNGRPRQWPLNALETLALLIRAPFARWRPPRSGESVAQWAQRILGSPVYRFLIAPALQGIYAGDPEALNAELIFGKFYGRSRFVTSRGSLRGTIAPEGGMATLITHLRRHLESRGVHFQFQTQADLRLIAGTRVVATSMKAAAELLGGIDGEVSALLAKGRMLPLVTMSLAYPQESKSLEGFGCLFPRGEGIRSLGVLFEQSIFGDRSEHHLERWILGGATDPEVSQLSDAEILAIVERDREKLIGEGVPAIGHRLIRWNPALPHYDHQMKLILDSPVLQGLSDRGVYLIGNYLGTLGLAGILEQAAELPALIQRKEIATT